MKKNKKYYLKTLYFLFLRIKNSYQIPAKILDDRFS